MWTPGQIVAMLLIALVAYFLGFARASYRAARRWLSVVKRTDLAWTICYRSMNATHTTHQQILLAGLQKAREKVDELQGRLDATAVPAERN